MWETETTPSRATLLYCIVNTFGLVRMWLDHVLRDFILQSDWLLKILRGIGWQKIHGNATRPLSWFFGRGLGTRLCADSVQPENLMGNWIWWFGSGGWTAKFKSPNPYFCPQRVMTYYIQRCSWSRLAPLFESYTYSWHSASTLPVIFLVNLLTHVIVQVPQARRRQHSLINTSQCLWWCNMLWGITAKFFMLSLDPNRQI